MENLVQFLIGVLAVSVPFSVLGGGLFVVYCVSTGWSVIHDCVFLVTCQNWLVQCIRVKCKVYARQLTFTRYTVMFNWSGCTDWRGLSANRETLGKSGVIVSSNQYIICSRNQFVSTELCDGQPTVLYQRLQEELSDQSGFFYFNILVLLKRLMMLSRNSFFYVCKTTIYFFLFSLNLIFFHFFNCFLFI